MAPQRRDTRQRILLILKRRGATSADALARQLRITAAGVRQHMLAMERDGLVSSQSERRPRGRPVSLWSATPAASTRFSDGHRELSLRLLDSVARRWGRRSLATLLQPLADAQVSQAVAEGQGARDPSARLRAFARQRRSEGYLTEVNKGPDGSTEVVECHCVVGAAARAFPDICAAEQRALRTLLGPGYSVDRVSHAASGASRCVYRVRRGKKEPGKTKVRH